MDIDDAAGLIGILILVLGFNVLMLLTGFFIWLFYLRKVGKNG